MLNLIPLLSGLVIFGFNALLTQSQLDGRIVGGIDTTIEQHPYQLSLELMESHYCGASLIKPNFALTAAHCTGNPPNLYRIRAGSTYRGLGGHLAQIIKICTHPKYQSNDYDVSALHLDQSFQLSASIQTIPLQHVGVGVPVGTQATATGWGALAFLGSASLILQEVYVPKVSDVECHISYPNSITDRMTCYGYQMGGKDSCQGDSGGPLVVNGKQVGIVSWGQGCAFPLKPGVYVRVENKEIIQHINYCLSNF